MLIDLLYAGIVLLAVWRGWRQGLIVGLFSLLAVFIGLAAALKLSAVVAVKLGSSTRIAPEWLPFISFLLVFIVVLLLVRLAAKALEKTAELALLGWLNKLGGIICFVVLYTCIFSVFLFYAEQMEWISPRSLNESATWAFVQPWAPRGMEALGKLIPWFRDLFEELKQFFASLSGHMAKG